MELYLEFQILLNFLSQMGSSVTILAQDEDGNLYDLATLLQETGNY